MNGTAKPNKNTFPNPDHSRNHHIAAPAHHLLLPEIHTHSWHCHPQKTNWAHLSKKLPTSYHTVHPSKKKISEGSEEILDSIRKGYVTYVINTSTEGVNQNVDGKIIRRCAIDNNVTVFTCLDTVKVLLDVLEEITMGISVIDKE